MIIKYENKKRLISFKDTRTITEMILINILNNTNISEENKRVFIDSFHKKTESYNEEIIWGFIEECLLQLYPDTLPDVDNSTEIGNQIVTYINKHIFDPNLSQMSVADEFGLSRPMISKLFKKSANINFIDYVHNHRIAKAKDLIKGGNININEVARKVGYVSEITFKRAFMRIEGTTPKGYIKKTTENKLGVPQMRPLQEIKERERCITKFV